jgi:hypothetical protein
MAALAKGLEKMLSSPGGDTAGPPHAGAAGDARFAFRRFREHLAQATRLLVELANAPHEPFEPTAASRLAWLRCRPTNDGPPVRIVP